MNTLAAYGVGFELGPGIEMVGLHSHRQVPARRCSVRLASRAALDDRWNGAAAVRVRELHHPGGELLLGVDHDPSRGYRLDAPFHGLFLVGSGGDDILCAPVADRPERWQHVLLAQLAPLAATLQGLEVFHAGAVSVRDGATLFCAASGTGKSALMARLTKLGAELVDDDAIAVEPAPGGGGALAHPGTELVHLTPDEASLLVGGTGRALGRVHGYRMAKDALIAPHREGPVPVRAVCMLERGGEGAAVEVERLVPDARALLTATFLPMVSDPVRLRRHFELCALLAETVPLHRVRAPESTSRDDLAGAVWQLLAT